MLNYEQLFFDLFNKLIKTKKYTDSWSISEDVIAYNQYENYELGWILIFKFYQNLYTLKIGYIPKLNILTINDRGNYLEINPLNPEKINSSMRELSELFLKLSDTLLIDAINGTI